MAQKGLIQHNVYIFIRLHQYRQKRCLFVNCKLK